MDPELAAALPAMPYVGLADPVAARESMRALAAALDEAPRRGGRPGPVGREEHDPRIEVADREIPGPPGGPPVPVRTYRPRHAAGPAPLLAYFHGGGFVTGEPANEHRRCLAFAADGTAVVSAGYRLAPEHPFPAGFDDAYAATVWAYEHAAELGGDPARAAVGGGSAGGGLAAGVALRARDEGGPPLAFQFLLYPVLDDRMDTPSARAFTEPPLYNRADVGHMWRHYLGALRDDPPAYAAPARAEDLSGLPPAYILAAEIDPLRDEDLDYAARLIRAGVPVELHHVPGVHHGFDGVRGTRVAERALAEQRAAVRRFLSPEVVDMTDS